MGEGDGEKKIVREIIEKSSPTGHLPRAPDRDGGTGASMPTGHLPSDAAPAPSPTPTPTESEKKGD